MSNNILNTLLKEYEYKKLHAELDLEEKKENLYIQLPKLREIENELNNYALNTTKEILKNGSSSLKALQDKINILKKEKEKILLSENIDENYLKPKYECALCKDTGYVRDNSFKTQMCNCLKQKLLNYSFNKSNMTNLNKENFNSFNENLFSDEVNVQKYKLNISPRENIENIKNRCIDFVNNFDNPENKNLLFCGNSGLRQNFYV